MLAAICGACSATAKSRTARDVFAWAGRAGPLIAANIEQDTPVTSSRHLRVTVSIDCHFAASFMFSDGLKNQNVGRSTKTTSGCGCASLFVTLAEEQASVQRAGLAFTVLICPYCDKLDLLHRVSCLAIGARTDFFRDGFAQMNVWA